MATSLLKRQPTSKVDNRMADQKYVAKPVQYIWVVCFMTFIVLGLTIGIACVLQLALVYTWKCTINIFFWRQGTMYETGYKAGIWVSSRKPKFIIFFHVTNTSTQGVVVVLVLFSSTLETRTKAFFNVYTHRHIVKCKFCVGFLELLMNSFSIFRLNEVRKQAHSLCKQFLHGPWAKIEENEFQLTVLG